MKTQSDVATTLFKAEQARHKTDSLINVMSGINNNIDHMIATQTVLIDVLGEVSNNSKVASNAMMQATPNN